MSCHSALVEATGDRLIALVGHSNVGKSALFHKLTGSYTPVSNFPGTTVEITRGQAASDSQTTIIDTPGVVTLPAASEDEQVTSSILLEEKLDLIIQVGDAKNLRRTLLLTLQLSEMGVPLVLALNMMDEARKRGIQVDAAGLQRQLGITIIPTVAVSGHGVLELENALKSLNERAPMDLRYASAIEDALAEMEPILPDSRIQPRSLGLLWLMGDPAMSRWLEEHLPISDVARMQRIREQAAAAASEPLEDLIERSRRSFLDAFMQATHPTSGQRKRSWVDRLSAITTHPAAGLPILVLVLLGLYYFVGLFGAGTLVDLLEVQLFGQVINPRVISAVESISPLPLLTEFLVGEFGLWTVGMTYALALIFPIVTTFFIAFGILEDSGYLPRLSVLTNKSFRLIGLNGRAVLPMILGLGCVTMATMSARILETKRERLLVILLLALAIPCSAQLGVVMGMLASISIVATMIWGGVVLAVLMAVGYLAARLLPGDSNPLMVELPPLRLPGFRNVLVKTIARLEWYMKEVVPLFLLGAAVMFGLDQLGWLQAIIDTGKPLVTGWLGLPPEASAALVMGFLRRDFGATGLFLMSTQGMLSPQQIVVAMVTVTLFIPCVASVLMVARERGWRVAAAIVAVIFPLAFLIGGLLHRLLNLLSWGLS
ncbi:MAG: ferrous iron transport protein B [Anaerolineales bacterium]